MCVSLALYGDGFRSFCLLLLNVLTGSFFCLNMMGAKVSVDRDRKWASRGGRTSKTQLVKNWL